MISLTLFIVLLFNTTVFAKVQVRQSSMENTLLSKQQLLEDKLSYRFTDPKRGDIIIFFEEEETGTIIDETIRTFNKMTSFLHKDSYIEDSRYVKRVIGIPGDTIDIKDGYVYVNDKKLTESYVKGETKEKELDLPITVGKNELFVLGDNREVSMDSRSFGPISIKQVEGKAIFRIYPFDKVGVVN